MVIATEKVKTKVADEFTSKTKSDDISNQIISTPSTHLLLPNGYFKTNTRRKTESNRSTDVYD